VPNPAVERDTPQAGFARLLRAYHLRRQSREMKMVLDPPPSTTFVPTNVSTYFAIASESLKRMEVLQESGRRPKRDGEPGWIISYDPDQKSFKEALITIVFSGIYLEALLHLLIVKTHGLSVFKRYDSKKTDADKLSLLGCTNASIVNACNRFKVVRREIVHEKAHLDSKSVRRAQDEAARSFKLIQSINAHFGIANG
jgi:hypothetical protein